MNFTINLFLPLLILFAMNVSIYRELRKLRGQGPGSDLGRKQRSSSLFVSNQDNSNQGNGSCSPRLPRRKLFASLRSRPNRDAEPGRSSFGNIASGFNDSRSKEDHDRDASYTRASILMVAAFVLCHTPRLITNILELFINQADMPSVSQKC